MNTVVRPFPSSSQPRDVAVERRGTGVARTARRRERDFGVGYGKSSGYASPTGVTPRPGASPASAARNARWIGTGLSPPRSRAANSPSRSGERGLFW